jgi:hypothetical protein
VLLTPNAELPLPLAALRRPKAELFVPLAAAPEPTAVALPPPVAVAWQFALLSKSVDATLPELHPAMAAGEDSKEPNEIAQPTNSVARNVENILDLTTAGPPGPGTHTIPQTQWLRASS